MAPGRLRTRGLLAAILGILAVHIWVPGIDGRVRWIIPSGYLSNTLNKTLRGEEARNMDRFSHMPNPATTHTSERRVSLRSGSMDILDLPVAVPRWSLRTWRFYSLPGMVGVIVGWAAVM
eukprot:1326459-Amorphochlora_amoeboformis.AAC.1